MNRIRWLLLGVLATLAAEAVAAAIFLRSPTPSAAERWTARRVRSLAVPTAAKAASNPEPDTPENLAVARAHWADHCASCHANDGSGSDMGKKMYPPAPDMRAAGTQGLTDGELFY